VCSWAHEKERRAALTAGECAPGVLLGHLRPLVRLVLRFAEAGHPRHLEGLPEGRLVELRRDDVEVLRLAEEERPLVEQGLRMRAALVLLRDRADRIGRRSLPYKDAVTYLSPRAPRFLYFGLLR